MKSKITKIQILKKGIALALSAMFLITPITYATTSLDDSYLESSLLDQLLYGKIGSTVKEIEEYFKSGETTLYITNETQLRAFAEYVNDGNDCSGKEIILLNDIEVDKNNEWIPIGNLDNPFSGTFNGKGNMISGIRIIQDEYDAKTDVSNVGLFGFVYNGTITRVNFNDIKIDAKTGINIGSLVGYLKSGNISLCNFIYEESDDVSSYEILGSSNVGGIVGKAEGSIIDSCNNDNLGIWSDNDYSMMYVGGIVGYTENVEIKNCSFTNHPRLYNSDYVGGIVGYASNAKIDNCITKGTFSAGNVVGGIVGWLRYTSTVKNCTNNSSNTISNGSKDDVNNATGGIVGEADNNEGEKIIISNSLNTSGVYSKNNKEYDFVYLGGIVGSCYANIEIVNCLNEGDVISFSDLDSEIYEYEGGIIGNSGDNSSSPSKGIIKNCVSSVEGLNIIGDNNSNIKIQNGPINYDILGANIPEDQGVIKSTLGVTKVIYTITKNGKAISEKEYFKAGDVIKVTANFDKYLAKTYGPLAPIADAPTLKINNKIEMTAGKITASNTSYTTSIEYTYTIEEGNNFEITSLNLYKNGTIYAVGSDYATVHPTISVNSASAKVSDIIVDTTKPIINTKVYVDNVLMTNRYTSGKEIKFEVTTSEYVKNSAKPGISVSFSKSGVGKYNGPLGVAKCIDGKINLDGTTTWTYSYIVQEFDEGQLEFEFIAGRIEDLAGNVTDLVELYTPDTEITSEGIKKDEWNNDLGVTYEFYKDSVSEANKVTSQTYFTEGDNLVVAATFDKVLYVHYGLSDGKNTNIRLNNTYKDRAPSLYLNGDSALKQSSIYSISTTNYVEDTSTSGTTRVLYVFSDIATNYGLKQLTQVENVVLKNENNEEPVEYNNTTVSTNGLIPYAEKYYINYKDEEEELYNKTLTSGKTKTTSGLDDILIDPVGVSDKIEKSDIYADTTAPTVEIITDKQNPTNADLIKYTFKFSEVVEEFTVEDITVNNGVKATKEVTVNGEKTQQPKFVEVVKGLEYTLEVEPTIVDGNEGEVQVIVEEGAVKDLVAINNVRQENNITIDKVVPTVEITADKDYVNADEKITYTFTWSEKIVSTFKEGIIITNGEIVDEITPINDLQATMGIKPTNGNDVKVLISDGTTKDIAGNENIEAKHIITVIPTVTITTNTTNPTNVNEIEYTFTWSEEIKGFEDKDIILPDGVVGTFEKVSDTVYKMKVDYNPIIPSGNEGEVTIAVVEKAVKDLNGNENAYTTNTLKIDRIAPIFIGLEAYATSDIKLNSEIDVVKEYYKAGETITVVATFTENIEKSTSIPALALQFSESGNAKGTINSTKSGNTIVYTYEIKDGDMGTLSVKGFSGVVTDNAGNEIKVTKRTLDGDTIIVDTNAPSLKELNVTTAEGIYKAGTTIEIEAIYDEEIYGLVNNEIKNISQDNTPILKLRLGNGAEKTATVRGYGETDGKEDKTKIRYTYTIVDGDNGLLAITSYDNKENIKVCDIAGNESSFGVNQTGNAITADTIRPEVTNITAEVENPTISNTGIYHKAGNEIKITVNFTEEVSAAKLWSRILIGFSEDENAEPTEYKEVLDLNATSQIREFSYTIQDGDNGYLWVKVEEGHFKDEAGNINIAEEATKIETVFADTTKPTLTIYKDTETTQNGQRLTVNATFSENLYGLSDNSRKTLETKDAPIIIYGFAGATGNLEEKAYSVGENVITYVITKENTVSGEFYHAYFRGNVYDRAGNECFTNDNLDTIAPVLESVVISSNSGIYSPYCKEGREIYVTATFDEPIKAENMKLKVKVGEVEITELLDGNIVEENKKQVKFTYTVKPGDMGEFKILDICGETDNEITEENADKTYGWVEDQHGNRNKIYNLSDEGVTATGKAEADTKNPYITSIKAIANGKEIATYTKEEGKDAVITVGRTNANIVEYIVTYSEKVPYSHFDKIRVINGEIKDIQYTNFELNEYKITVQITKEGVQSLIINEGTVEDKAGNIDAFVRLDAVTVDFSKPTVRFISEYNGGEYVLPTNIDKVEVRPNVEISEDIAKIEYKWNNGEYDEIENYSSSSDIAIPTKAFTEAGTHVLHIRVEDLAGNVSETSKTYKILNSNIEISTDITVPINTIDNGQPVIATVSFKDGLTDNRKVTFKEAGSEELVELNARGTNEDGTEYSIWTNGIIYAEATDRVGNKVFTEHPVTNIDNDAPEITFDEYYLTTLVNKDIKVVINLNESAKISYSWDNTTWEETSENVTFLDITKKFTEVGKYTLYVKAIDAAENESSAELEIEVTNLSFTVLGNATTWTSNNVELYIDCEEELASITVNGQSVNTQERIYHAEENGEYVFVVTDKYGNSAVAIDSKGNIIEGNKIIVDKIDKEGPTIENIDVDGRVVTITAKDDKSGLKEYAITNTTEVPVEWSESNTIKVAEDGTFYVWAKDKVGNITIDKDIIVVDTKAPVITFNYLSQTVTVGMPLEANIVTDEGAIISYSWDKENWVNSEELISSIKVSEKSTTPGKYTLYVKAKDAAENESKVQALEFEVVRMEEIKQPDIIFEDIATVQVNGAKYVKISSQMTAELLTDSMNKEALCGKTPEYINLTEDGKFKTGSEIAINGSTKYIIVVNGDVDGDGKVTFLGDIVKANDYRIGIEKLTTIQMLAGDINNNGKIEFISDIVAMNDYRLGIINSL